METRNVKAIAAAVALAAAIGVQADASQEACINRFLTDTDSLVLSVEDTMVLLRNMEDDDHLIRIIEQADMHEPGKHIAYLKTLMAEDPIAAELAAVSLCAGLYTGIGDESGVYECGLFSKAHARFMEYGPDLRYRLRNGPAGDPKAVIERLFFLHEHPRLLAQQYRCMEDMLDG